MHIQFKRTYKVLEYVSLTKSQNTGSIYKDQSFQQATDVLEKIETTPYTIALKKTKYKGISIMKDVQVNHSKPQSIIQRNLRISK